MCIRDSPAPLRPATASARGGSIAAARVGGGQRQRFEEQLAARKSQMEDPLRQVSSMASTVKQEVGNA
eukprot:14143521-Alexandrium_andersonii.AAC.1